MPKKNQTDEEVRRTQEEAWTGDAVLGLYAREWILREYDRLDGSMLQRFTSNQFLACTGKPTEVEAEIGRVYQDEGLEAAFAWIERELLPLFLKQEKNR